MWDLPRVSQMAVEYVKDYMAKEGWTVKTSKDVSGEQKWIGYDLLAIRGNEFKFIEVKGTEKEFAIPDMIETEFTRNLTLIATHLYVVGNLKKKDKKPVLYIIPRRAFKKEHFRVKQLMHFRKKFNKEFTDKYKVSAVTSF